MLARTKDIGAGGFRARSADGALAATGGVSPSPRWDGLLGPHRWSPGSAAQHQGAPTASGPGAVCSSRGATRTGSAGAARRARHCPKAIRAHGTWRLPQAGTTPSQLIPAAGDADRDHIGDAVEAQRGQAQTAVAGPPPSGAGRTCQRRASRACARRRRRSCRRRPCVPPPGAARQCRAGVVMEGRPPVAQQLGA
jgi:hypothetical protein